MSAQTLHKRPPKLHLGHDEKVHTVTTSADEINNSNDFNICNTTMASSPSTPTTPSTPSSPAISKPPKKRYLENGGYRCTPDDRNASHEMTNLMELAKVCSNTSKCTGSSSCGSNYSNKDSKTFGSVTDFQTNVNCSYTQNQVSKSAVNDVSSRIPTSGSTYNQIPIFDVDIAGRIRDSDLFETSSSSASGTPSVVSNSRAEEPLNLCTDKKTITTCQQDLISRMVDKLFCDPKESKGTLLDSFLLRMNSHKKLPQSDKGNKHSSNKSKEDRIENASSDGEEVECVGSYKNIKLQSNSDRTGTPKTSTISDVDDRPVHCKNERKDNVHLSNCVEEENKINTEQKNLFQKRSHSNSPQNTSVETVTTSEKLITDTLSNISDDYGMATSPSSKEGQRKSQRSSKGKRYQAFLTEGFLHPLKERKLMRRNNNEEQIDNDKCVKDVDVKSVSKPNKKRKVSEMREDREKSSTKERYMTEETLSRENKTSAQHKEDDNEMHRLRKARKKNSSSDKYDPERINNENQDNSSHVSSLTNETEIKSTNDIEDSKNASYTQKSQSDENQTTPTEHSSYLNTDDSKSPPKLMRMDEVDDDDDSFSNKE